MNVHSVFRNFFRAIAQFILACGLQASPNNLCANNKNTQFIDLFRYLYKLCTLINMEKFYVVIK